MSLRLGEHARRHAGMLVALHAAPKASPPVRLMKSCSACCTRWTAQRTHHEAVSTSSLLMLPPGYAVAAESIGLPVPPAKGQ